MIQAIFLFHILLLVTAIDPWDVGAKIEYKNFESNSCNSLSEPKEWQNSIGDTFYRRLLGLIVSRGRFKQNEGETGVDGSLHIQLSLKEFETLTKYASKSDPFTSEEYRKIDGIITNSVYESSISRQFAERFSLFTINFLQKYYIHIYCLFGSALVFYSIYKSKFSWRHLNLRILKIGFFSVFFVSSVAWEIMLGIEEADKKDYEEFVQSTKSCDGADCVPYSKKIYYYLHYLHPLKILGNLATKFIINNVKETYISLDGLILKISGQTPWGLQTQVHIILSMFLIVLLVTLGFGFICFLLNRPFSLSFLFVNFNFSQKKNEKKESNEIRSVNLKSPNGIQGDSLSGDNLNILLDVFKKSIEVTSNKSTDSPHVKKKKDLSSQRSLNLQQSKTLKKIPCFVIPPRKVGYLPDYGGGDSPY